MRFGGDLSLDERGVRDVRAIAASSTWGDVVCGPERAVVGTAELLVGARPDGIAVDVGLRSLDVGCWHGLAPEQLDPTALRAFFTDPGSRPHGGESVAHFVERIHHWRAAAGRQVTTVVVAKPVAQALMAADTSAYFAVDIRPATVYR